MLVIGYITIFISALFFYLSTYYLKIGLAVEAASPLIYVHLRFVMGFVIFFPSYWINRKKIKIVNQGELFRRSFSNALAVFFFYMAVDFGTVTNANLLNMAYPAFVALLAPWLAQEKLQSKDILVIFLTLAGVVAIALPNAKQFIAGDTWGLLSGIVSGWAIVSLRIVRKADHTYTILAFVFGFGTFLFLPIYPFVEWPSMRSIPYLIGTAALGVLGQLLLTYGYRYVTAIEGSIISSSRILMALLVGLFLLKEPVVWLTIIGGLVLFAAHVINVFPKREIQKK